MNPFAIDPKQLTKFVLSHLEPILLPRPNAKEGNDRGTDDCLGARLPQELQDIIESYLAPSFVDPDPKANRILPGSWWKEALMHKKLLPWLWDLDVKMIRRKASNPPKNWFGAAGTWMEWDWESLVRQLAQTHFYKNFTLHNSGAGIALALKNRRRIFLIMDDLCKTAPCQTRMEPLVDWEEIDCPER
jgi:hypothetical protein